jgi:nucleotide-binding universal stress UspA family protein
MAAHVSIVETDCTPGIGARVRTTSVQTTDCVNGLPTDSKSPVPCDSVIRTIMSTSTQPHHSSAKKPQSITHIGVGIDGFPEGRDAATLAAAIGRATGADLLLIAVHPEPIVVLPQGLDWKSGEEDARTALREVRDEIAPEARMSVETDFWIARALQRAARREHRDLLVVGSSRHAADGHVRIGKRTRQLLCNFDVTLAVAPRGLNRSGFGPIRRIGVGYDGGPEAQRALELAASIGAAAGAELRVLAAVDDRMPSIGWPYLFLDEMIDEWRKILEEEEESLRSRVKDTVQGTNLKLHCETVRGRPADHLVELSSDVDMMVIGSRRWGPVARVLLGSTGEALMHDAACPVVVTPRPEE